VCATRHIAHADFLLSRARFSRKDWSSAIDCTTTISCAGSILDANHMHKTNSIVMHAPKTAIFETVANLELWPAILPHYRYIRFLERGQDRNIVVMAARRSGIPISWMSEQIIDRDNLQIRFHHLKAWTKGMHVVWTFADTPDGVLVTISHDLRFRISLLAPIVNPIMGDFFIGNIANKTLRCMKAYLEAKADKVTV
jgi:ribosome-associated toxin RatA of RatAB toxin-antitoxin module